MNFFVFHAGLMSTYCWISGTYTIKSKLSGTIGVDAPHPGVGPSLDPNLIEYNPETSEEHRHAWYQWTAWVLFLQAVSFYLPHYLWKCQEGGKIDMLVKDLGLLGLDSPESKREKRLTTVNYFVRTLGSHTLYVAKYVFCEVLNLVNVFGQMYFMDFFLGGHFMTYGLEVMSLSEQPMEDRVDPMSKVFPKVCNFQKSSVAKSIWKY